jgi:hypothetical protein
MVSLEVEISRFFIGSFKRATRELAKYKIDLVRVEIR